MRVLVLLLFFATSVSAQPLAVTNTFLNNTVADATDINQNFADIVNGVNNNMRVDFFLDNIVVGDGLENVVPDTSEFQYFDNGQELTAIGFGALFHNDTGGFNTAIGSESLHRNKRGFLNTAVGWASMRYNTGGFVNTAVGSAALDDNTDGYNNTAVGGSALSSNTVGHSNTAVGTYADTAQPDLFNSVAIGYQAEVDASNKIQLGNTSVTSVATSGKLTTGDVTYPNTHGANGQVLGTSGSGELVWVGTNDIIARHTQELEEQVASLQEQLQSQQEELLAIVESQQAQIAQLQKMVEHQFAVN